MLKKFYDTLSLDPRPTDGGGTATFEAKVLSGIETLNSRTVKMESDYQKVTSDLDRADKAVKEALEQLTKVKNQANDADAFMKNMEKVQKAIMLNVRSSFKSPIDRALASDETRAFLNAAARAACFPGEYHRLPGEMRKLLEDSNARHKSLTGVDSSLGQATIPQETFDSIYDTLLEYGDWGSLGVQRVGARTTVLPVATSRPQFYWIGANTGTAESSAITAGSFAGSSVNLTIQTLAAYLLVSRELLADSTVDMAPFILRQMTQAIAFGLDSVAFNASAAADQTDAGYTGIFHADSVNSQLAYTAAAGNTRTGLLQLEDLLGTILNVSPIVLKRQAKWWMHPQILARVCLIRDKQGRSLFQTFTEAPSSAIGSILGYPVVPTAAAPSSDAASQPLAVFGDPEGMAVGIRADMEFATSDDIKFAENMRAFRTLMRAGVQIKSTTGSTTLKPFSVLKTPAA